RTAQNDCGRRARWIHFLAGGSEHELTKSGELGAILFKHARIFGKVLTGCKLGRVYEDRHHDSLGSLSGETNDRHVALVQRPHGRHEGNTALLLAPFGDNAPKLYNSGSNRGWEHSYFSVQGVGLGGVKSLFSHWAEFFLSPHG